MTNALKQKITERAYALYLSRGGDHGSDLQDWYKAEQEIIAEENRKNEELNKKKTAVPKSAVVTQTVTSQVHAPVNATTTIKRKF